jgi:uncharacterized membrane protein (DUF2068 family)
MRGTLDLRLGHAELDREAQLKLLRAVASFEIAKGLIVLLAGCSVLFLVHKDAGDLADTFLRLLHISPDHHFAQAFLTWADSLTDAKLWAVAGVATVYAIVRFIEAYGLWKARAWAEWFALVSGAMYLPYEIYKLIERVSPLHVTIIILNLAVVLFMGYLRISAHKARMAQLACLARSRASES